MPPQNSNSRLGRNDLVLKIPYGLRFQIMFLPICIVFLLISLLGWLKYFPQDNANFISIGLILGGIFFILSFYAGVWRVRLDQTGIYYHTWRKWQVSWDEIAQLELESYGDDKTEREPYQNLNQQVYAIHTLRITVKNGSHYYLRGAMIPDFPDVAVLILKSWQQGWHPDRLPDMGPTGTFYVIQRVFTIFMWVIITCFGLVLSFIVTITIGNYTGLLGNELVQTLSVLIVFGLLFPYFKAIFIIKRFLEK